MNGSKRRAMSMLAVVALTIAGAERAAAPNQTTEQQQRLANWLGK